MANEEQLSILKQGVEVWNKWRAEKLKAGVAVDLSGADLFSANLREAFLVGVDFTEANLIEADLSAANLRGTYLDRAKLFKASLRKANLMGAYLIATDLMEADLYGADLSEARIIETNLSRANLCGANLRGAYLKDSIFLQTKVGPTNFGRLDLSEAITLEKVIHINPSSISTDTFALSKGKIPEIFLRGCGLSDADIEYAKLSNPDLRNEEVNQILYKIYDLHATQPLQISPLFISYSHGDSKFIDKLETHLNEKGIRFWRDIHEMKAGRMEKQIDRAISQNPTVLLVLSGNSLSSDWVEHEVRTARGLEKDMGRDVLCPVALDDSWKSSRWPQRIMEQIMEYNILDFSAWQDNSKFEGMFRKLIDGLQLFYKG